MHLTKLRKYLSGRNLLVVAFLLAAIAALVFAILKQPSEIDESMILVLR